jgi:CO dehydrogenase/acetyl-CoA synthase gamma subunit (corrinoid Fe-S protein)
VPDANLYLDRIDLARYLSTEECRKCGARSCKELVERLRERRCQADDLATLAGPKRKALGIASGIDAVLPAVPQLQLPQPAPAGLVALNDPGPGDPVLVTGNSELTQQVLLAVLADTLSPFHVLFTDTRGDTLDMAIILGSFTPGRVRDALKADPPPAPGTLTLPGFAADLRDAIADATGWPVEVGPVCAAELPLYFGDRWIPVGG